MIKIEIPVIMKVTGIFICRLVGSAKFRQVFGKIKVNRSEETGGGGENEAKASPKNHFRHSDRIRRFGAVALDLRARLIFSGGRKRARYAIAAILFRRADCRGDFCNLGKRFAVRLFRGTRAVSSGGG